MIIGIANIIPGLSGATLAFILGIYQKLIQVLTRFDTKLIFLLKNRNIKEVKKYISFNFLISILIGIVISFVALAKVLNFLFTHFELYTWSYFFGIIAGSIFYIIKYIDRWTKLESLLFICGLCISLGLLFVEPNLENKNLIFCFICGVIAIVGMLVPGLSGSYLLVLLGNYKLILVTTIKNITNPTLINQENYFYVKLFITFLFGQIIGVLMFSRLIKWLIEKYKNPTFSTLAGFVTGSLIYIWPWQNNLQELQLIYNLSLPTFTKHSDLYSILIIVIGILTIIGIEKLAEKYQNV